MARVEGCHGVCQHGRVLATGGCYGYTLARLEELAGDDGLVHLILEGLKEALLANLHTQP